MATRTSRRRADGKLALWLNRSKILIQTEPRSTREQLTSKHLTLLRQQTPLQLNYTEVTPTGGIRLHWSHPFQPTQPVPTSNLYPPHPRRPPGRELAACRAIDPSLCSPAISFSKEDGATWTPAQIVGEPEGVWYVMNERLI